MLDHSTPLADWVVVLPVILSLAGAALLLVLRRFVRWQPWLCAAALLLVFACDAMLVQWVLASGPLSMTMGHWLPPFGISFTADAMGACFALAASFVALCVLLYMQGDAPDSAVRDGVYPLLLLLIAGVSGAFLTGDLFNLYVWFEVMLIASFGLVVLAGHPLQLDAAVKYAIPNIVGTTLFLAALGLLYGLVGTLNMADIIGAAARADPALLAAVGALFLLAFGIKAAVFPVNAWLPASYHAPPAALSALLAALLSEVGVYAVIRVFVMLLPTIHETLGPVIFICGVLTVVLGPLLAIAETNLRRAIGFLLIGGVGVALLGVPEGHMSGYFAAVSYVLAAIPTLAALYLCAGLVERLSGHSDVREMAGLQTASPLLSLLFLVLVLAIAGVPPFLGFWPKLLFLQAFLQDGNWIAVFALLLNSLLVLIAGARLWTRIFWRSGTQPVAAISAQGLGAAALLTGTIFLLGLWPSLMLKTADAASQGLADPARYIAAVGLSP